MTDNLAVASGGGAAYLRLGVSPGAFAGVTVRSGRRGSAVRRQ